MSEARTVDVVVALGSNLGRRRDTIMAGVAELARLPGTRLLATSRLRPTEPVGAPAGSPPFINGACRLTTTLAPRPLLDALLEIERRHGRTRGAPNAPRTLDLDLILYGDQVLDEPGLSVPHPRAHLRDFVLEPAAEIAGELRHPRLGATLGELHRTLARRTRPLRRSPLRRPCRRPGDVKTVRALPEVIDACRRARTSGRLGLVPTMGALHEGHLSLVRRAAAECDAVAVSIFVNPLQFGRGEDYAAYPRDEAGDAEMLRSAGADLLLVLDADEMYPPDFATHVVPDGPAEGFEARERPGHFTGVCTIVAKLLNLAGPHRCYLGRKDYQQAVVVRRMAADLHLPGEVVVCDTVRDDDGLALSSRNRYLDAAHRRRALALVAALQRAEDLFEAGERGVDALQAAMAEVLAAGIGRPPDYAAVVDPHDLSAPPVARPGDVALLAARVGPARLLDNHVLGAKLGPFAPPTEPTTCSGS